MNSRRQRKVSASLRAPLRVHFENVSSLGPVFEVTRERANAHLSAHGLAKYVEVSVGVDGHGFGNAVARADILSVGALIVKL